MNLKKFNQKTGDLFNKRFETELKNSAPLAERMRPERLEDFFGALKKSRSRLTEM